MKKNKTKNHEQKQKPRRLRLSRETIRNLNDPALLALARGGVMQSNFESCGPGTDNTAASSC